MVYELSCNIRLCYKDIHLYIGSQHRRSDEQENNASKENITCCFSYGLFLKTMMATLVGTSLGNNTC